MHWSRTGPDPVQQAAVLALGSCNPGCVSILLEEMQGMGDDPTAERTKVHNTPNVLLPNFQPIMLTVLLAKGYSLRPF